MDYTVWMISLLFGLALMLALWSIYRIFTEVPAQNRAYLDRPPLGYRLGWPLIQLTSHYFGRFISPKYRQGAEQKLRRAGMQYTLSPEQYLMGRVLMAVLAMLLGWLVATILHKHLSLAWLLILAIGGYFYPALWLKETTGRRERRIFRDLPFYLDIIVLAVESGSNFNGGLTHAVRKAPASPLKLEFGRVLRDVRAGKSRADALRRFADNVDGEGVKNMVSSVIQAEQTGSSLGPVLRAQADQLRSKRFLKAEKLAMEAPVKLLGPLVMFIFPNTFLILGFLLLSKAILQGVINWAPLVWAYTWPGGG